MTKYALLSAQGTACTETTLEAKDYSPDSKRRVEQQFCDGGHDSPVPGTWTDIADNEAA